MRSVVLIAAISVYSASCAVAEAGVLWASVPGTGNSSTLYGLDSTNGKVLGSIALPFNRADDFSFSNDGQSIWVVDTSFWYVNHIDLAGNLLSQYFVTSDVTCLAVLPDDTIAVGGSDGIHILDPSTGGAFIFVFQFDIASLASNGVDRVFSIDEYGYINTYDLYGNILDSLWTDMKDTRGLAYTGTSFLIASAGGTIQEIDPITGDLINSFAGPRGFTGGLDFVADGQAPPSPVPEPTSVLMMLAGVGMVLAWRQHRMSRVSRAV